MASNTKPEKSLPSSKNEEILCLKICNYMLIFGITQIILGFCLPIVLWQFDEVIEEYGLDLGFWTGLAFIIFGIGGLIFVGSNIPSKCMVITHFVLPIVTSVFILIILTLMKIMYANYTNLSLFD